MKPRLSVRARLHAHPQNPLRAERADILSFMVSSVRRTHPCAVAARAGARRPCARSHRRHAPNHCAGSSPGRQDRTAGIEVQPIVPRAAAPDARLIHAWRSRAESPPGLLVFSAMYSFSPSRRGLTVSAIKPRPSSARISLHRRSWCTRRSKLRHQRRNRCSLPRTRPEGSGFPLSAGVPQCLAGLAVTASDGSSRWPARRACGISSTMSGHTEPVVSLRPRRAVRDRCRTASRVQLRRQTRGSTCPARAALDAAR